MAHFWNIQISENIFAFLVYIKELGDTCTYYSKAWNENYLVQCLQMITSKLNIEF